MNANQIALNGSTAVSGAYAVGNFNQGECRTDLQKEWIARPADQRFLNLSDLREFCFDRYRRSTETRTETKKIEFIAPETQTLDNMHKLGVGLPNGEEVAPSHWSFGQVCRLAKAPQSYLSTLPSALVADNLNFSLRYSREVESVKLYHDSASLMAATGPDYGRIFDYELVEAVQNIAGNGTGDQRWKIPGMLDWGTMKYNPDHPVSKDTTTLYASDRDVYIFLVDDRNPIEVGKLPNGDPDYLFRGFYCKNSEFGNGLLVVSTFYLRGICCNRLMWGVEGFQQVEMIHSKMAPSRFIEQIRPALVSYAESSSVTLVDAVAKCKAAQVVANKEEGLEWLNNRGLTRKRALAVWETVMREEQHEPRSVWDMAQGITAEARREINTDTRMELELTAKSMLEKVAA
jgi:hypothetical protein